MQVKEELINYAVMFPGQGSQYPGMGKNLYDSRQEAREIFKRADDIVGFDLTGLCFEGSTAELTKTSNAQAALLVVSYAMYISYVWNQSRAPVVYLGHSLGEITALTCAGAIKFDDAVKIARSRGLHMQDSGEKAGGSMMAVVGEGVAREINGYLGRTEGMNKDVEVANYNSHNQVVVSGGKEGLKLLGNILKEKGLKTIPLNVSAAFHSVGMIEARNAMKLELKNYTFQDICTKVISNVTAREYVNKEEIEELLTKHITSPVKWTECVEKARSRYNVSTFVEVGPKTVLKNLVKGILPDADVLGLDSEDDRQKFLGL